MNVFTWRVYLLTWEVYLRLFPDHANLGQNKQGGQEEADPTADQNVLVVWKQNRWR